MSMENSDQVDIYTIGFTKKGANRFFELLRDANITKLVDTRINNRSQLSGFAKRDDLIFFLDEILDAEYVHDTDLAPTKNLLDEWRNDKISWNSYEERFRELMVEREIETKLDKSTFTDPTVLLCSEHKPDHCHRRLIVEYLDDTWGNVNAIHLS
ncbi:DUF488 domain-containing protein [Halorubrum ezzemoulense]|uniref:DUF488 domain-containing protein n=1 Tax=Halorubrum ezzemoulense TaxID=337243 RepID=UPI00232D5541|nr:DUF488 domain-containing protein [Halorubrum ezzemoulense]MDB2240815.1 DUF488 domain-containing protein [Halorubrum ezzemoulense]